MTAPLSLFSQKTWETIFSYTGGPRAQDQRCTPENIQRLTNDTIRARIQEVTPSDLESINLAADRYQFLTSYNPSLVKTCRTFHNLFKEQPVKDIETTIRALLDTEHGKASIQACILCNFYLETFFFYFSHHPQDIEHVFSDYAASFVRGTTPFPRISLFLEKSHPDLFVDQKIPPIHPPIFELFDLGTPWESVVVWVVWCGIDLVSNEQALRMLQLRKLLRKKIVGTSLPKAETRYFQKVQTLPIPTNLPPEMWAKICSHLKDSLPANIPYTLENIDRLPEPIRDRIVTRPDPQGTRTSLRWFDRQLNIEMQIASSIYKDLAYNPSLAKTSGEFRAILLNPSNLKCIKKIERVVYFILRYETGRAFILDCINFGFYLETLRLYFSLHPEDLEMMFPRIVQSFGAWVSPIKFISSLLSIGKNHQLGLLEKTFDGKSAWEMTKPFISGEPLVSDEGVPENKDRWKELRTLFETKMTTQALMLARARALKRVITPIAVPVGSLAAAGAVIASAVYASSAVQNFLRFKR